MSELQDRLDRGEITAKDFFDAWDREMEENERLHPGFHDRWYRRLNDKFGSLNHIQTVKCHCPHIDRYSPGKEANHRKRAVISVRLFPLSSSSSA
jgi:hypothetical protein